MAQEHQEHQVMCLKNILIKLGAREHVVPGRSGKYIHITYYHKNVKLDFYKSRLVTLKKHVKDRLIHNSNQQIRYKLLLPRANWVCGQWFLHEKLLKIHLGPIVI